MIVYSIISINFEIYAKTDTELEERLIFKMLFNTVDPLVQLFPEFIFFCVKLQYDVLL